MNYWGWKTGIMTLIMAGVMGNGAMVLAQSTSQTGSPTVDRNADRFPPSPLEVQPPDPLLPNPPSQRPLTALEQQNLRTALDELNQQARAQLEAGNDTAAYQLWYRELRLRRVLGPLEEIPALGRVGGIAWERSQKDEVNNITKRLQAIELEQLGQPKPESRPPERRNVPVNAAPKSEILQALGTAYQQVRSPGLALNIHQQILAQARQRQDLTAQKTTLQTIANLHLAWFDYEKAAVTYEELFNLAQAQNDTFNQVQYLQELSRIYDKAKQPINAVKIKQRLLSTHEKNPENQNLIAPLKISIGTDYEALNQLEEARQEYQSAYEQARLLQQYSIASEALQRMAKLYENSDQLDYALEVYQISMQVSQLSYDFYGLMNIYDRMGQIYRQQQRYSEALSAFQQGLKLAQSLKHRESYFEQEIQALIQDSRP